MYPQLLKERTNHKLTVLLGSRRSGKTTLMRMLQDHYQKAGELTAFLDLDLVANLENFQSLDHFLRFIKLRDIKQTDRAVFFIDEFQHIDSATKILKNLYDHFPNFKFYISGSSSLQIIDKLDESLAGRKRIYHIYPLDFLEFLQFKQRQDLVDQLGILADFDQIDNSVLAVFEPLLEEYMVFGGYPEVVLAPTKEDKIREIRDIVDSYVRLDIQAFLGVRNVLGYHKLLEVLALLAGQQMNVSRLTQETGLNRQTVESYLDILEHTFIMGRLRPYLANLHKQMVKSPKVYFLDAGIRNYLINNFQPLAKRTDAGSLAENFVYSEIIKQDILLARIYYYRTRTKTEVDFIVQTGDQVLPIEVKWQKYSTPDYLRNLIAFVDSHSPQQVMVLNRNLKINSEHQGVAWDYLPLFLWPVFLKKFQADLTD